MLAEGELEETDVNLENLRTKDYILLETEQDRDAAHRWNIANDMGVNFFS